MPFYNLQTCCEREFSCFTPDKCRDPVLDCNQPFGPIIEADEMPIDDLDDLRNNYTLPDCPVVGCKRFFGSAITENPTDPRLDPDHPFTYFTMDDLIPK